MLKRYSSIAPLLFDGNVAQTFLISMRNDVQSARIRNIAPGALYTFIFKQDQFGGHNFPWPSVCLNAAPIDQTPLSTTVQNFVGQPGGFLQSNAASTWRES